MQWRHWPHACVPVHSMRSSGNSTYSVLARRFASWSTVAERPASCSGVRPAAARPRLPDCWQAGRLFVELLPSPPGVKDVRAAIEAAKERLAFHGERTVLFVDEVHRFSKSQQDALLPGVEAGLVTFVGATTENPFFSVISPLLSRSLLLTLEPLDDEPSTR